MARKSEAKKKDILWDRGGLARKIDHYWTSSPDEIRHRANIAGLVCNLISSRSDTILEVGCGTGLVYGALLDLVGPDVNYTGIDISKKMLAIAGERYSMGTFIEGDAFDLKYGDRSFDIACAFEVFGHYKDPSDAIKELVRVARRLAVFSMWLTLGDKVAEGTDRYEYPKALVEKMIPKGHLVSDHDLGYTRAFIVRKA